MAKDSKDGVAQGLIASAGGRVTRPRVVVLKALLDAGHAASHAELHRRLPNIDRVTLYRALDWLADHRLAHRIADADGVRRYEPSLPTDHRLHPHFQCTNCGVVTCLDMEQGPTIRLPGGFTSQDIEILVKGVCRNCASVN